jgi:hypothetical protein
VYGGSAGSLDLYPETSVMDEATAALAAGLRDRYVLERELGLGLGGMATVYLARITSTNASSRSRCCIHDSLSLVPFDRWDLLLVKAVGISREFQPHRPLSRRPPPVHVRFPFYFYPVPTQGTRRHCA